MQQPVPDHDGDVCTPRVVRLVEQSEIQISCLIPVAVCEVRVAPELAGPVLGHPPIEQRKELIRVSLTVRAELERRERGRLRMSIRTVRGVRHPGRPAARRPKHLAEILLRQHHSRVPPQRAVRATAVPRPRHRMGYSRRAADRIASEDAYPSAASALKLPQ